MFNKTRRLLLLLLIMPLVISACSLPWKKKAPDQPVVFPAVTGTEGAEEAESEAPLETNQIRKFSDYEELAAWLAENSNPESALTRGPLSFGLAMDSSSLKSPAGEAGQSLAVNSSDYSTTNNQVKGVDEADIIKTDGSHIYALVRNELLIIKVAPATGSEIVSKITFQSRPEDIFIQGDALAVFGADEQIYSQPFYESFRRYNPYAFFKVFDISDPVNPKVMRDLSFEGSYKAARLVGDYVYFVTETYGSYIANEPLVPRVIDGGQILALSCDGAAKCFTPSVYYFDIPYDSYSFNSITAINLKDAAEPVSGEIYLMNGGQNLYVSGQNIYITYAQYLDEYDLEQLVKRELIYARLSEADQERVADIEASPGHVINIHEKKMKTAQIIDRYLASLTAAEQKTIATEIDAALAKKLSEKAAEMEKTVVHKIAISGNRLEYRAMGEVPGQLLNQFSMDENGEYFRLATTRSAQWSRLSGSTSSSYNNVYVLDKDLKIVGRLENLATTERIYSVRFLGDRAYLVTFKQTDPLFAISLADPTKPTVLNAIKVPGFSNYLHPVDSSGNKLIGLGRDTEETASGGVNVKGLKLSLYDFSDTAKPRELDNYLIGDSSSDSIALSDHRAFLYSAAKNILVIPAVLRENGRLNFAGALVFSIENDRLSLKGRIDHSVGGRYTQPDYWNGYNYYDNTVKRSLYINDNLFTFSNKFLKINSLADLTELKTLELTVGGDDYIITPLTPGSDQVADGEGPESPEEPPVLPEVPEEEASPGEDVPPAEPEDECCINLN